MQARQSHFSDSMTDSEGKAERSRGWILDLVLPDFSGAPLRSRLGLVAASLVAARFGAVGLDAIRFDAVGLDAVGLGAVGLGAVGFEAARLPGFFPRGLAGIRTLRTILLGS
jgi:hypothetical protein